MIATSPEAVGSPEPDLAPEADEVMLSVQGVSKHYKLWSSPTVRLRYSILSQAHRTLRQVLPKNSAPLRLLQRWRERLYRDFTALQELSFEVRRGESLGIIGRNGSGKSTLLQIIAGTLRPSTGRVDVYGRVAALLELGSGFNPEFTGRENVYLNASILGLSQEETDAKYESIVAFADIGQFLEQPVKTYSSGMMLRLAFAVSINVEPDLLIIDEALAVGDVFFTQKCFQRLREIIDGGTTLLFVSHSMAAVQNLCQRALLLKEGEAIFEGPPEEAASRYYAVCAGGTKDKRRSGGGQHQPLRRKHGSGDGRGDAAQAGSAHPRHPPFGPLAARHRGRARDGTGWRSVCQRAGAARDHGDHAGHLPNPPPVARQPGGRRAHGRHPSLRPDEQSGLCGEHPATGGGRASVRCR